MGTRGAYGFRIGGVDKLSYTHWGGCPDGAGGQVLQFLKDVPDDELREIAASVRMVDEENKPTSEEIELCRKAGLIDLHVSGQSVEDWYCLLRNAQGDLNVLRKTAEQEPIPFMLDNSLFPRDSLFCEGAYILNLDTMKYEVYAGFNKDSLASGRYAQFRERGSEYCGVRLIWEIPFDEARELSEKEFVAEANRLSE